MDACVDQLNRLYRYTGAAFYAALFTGATTNQQVTAVDISTDTFTSTAHNLVDGCRVQFITSGALPVPLALNTTYFVISATANTFKVSAARGGTAIDITALGSGTLTVIEQAPDPKLDSLAVWARLESNYFGSSRQLMTFAAATSDPDNNRAQMADLTVTFAPTTGSISYQYFGVIADAVPTRGNTQGRIHFIQNFGTTQTIINGFSMAFNYKPTAPLGS